MFKLKKIVNGRINTPEPVRMPIDTTMPYTANCMYFLLDGILAQDSVDSKSPKYVALESRDENDSKSSLLAYRVTSDMILEADVINASSAMVGGEGAFVARNNLSKTHFDAAASGYPEAVVVDKSEALSKGKVLIQVLL